jgi:FkbM family methyltransferase
MRMISYAQNGEDVILDRVFPRGVPGTYVDVGAFDPVVASVTKHFYDLGWRGINVEPASGPFQRLQAGRDRDVNLNIGLSNEPGTLTLYESAPEAGWSTFDPAQAEWHRDEGLELLERTVPVRTLRDVCEEYVEGTIDFMSIDVEGHEAEVLEGGDWEQWRPRVVVVEATKPGTSIPSYEAWEPILLKANYIFATFDGLNRYYLRSEDADLAPAFEAPANVLDDYVPYAHHKRIEEFRKALGSTLRSVAAARAENELLRAEGAGYRDEVEFLRGEFRRLDMSLAETRGRYEWAAESIREARDTLTQLRDEVATVRAGLEELLADVGPMTLAAARTMGRVGRRVPGAGAAVRVARGLRRMRRAASR